MSLYSSDLLSMSQEAMEHKEAQRWQAAAHCFEQILAIQPNWEHGYGWFNLAGCYEDCGRISDARAAYEKAVHASPNDSILVGGLASFLYLHGQAIEAFDQYIQLLVLDRFRVDTAGEERTMMALDALASRLGWTANEVSTRIDQKLAQLHYQNKT
jgi:tetratricopeptide (TPR) repeat protein